MSKNRQAVHVERDNCRPVAISLSSNHSLRAATVYASTEVGTWLLSVLTILRSNAFVRRLGASLLLDLPLNPDQGLERGRDGGEVKVMMYIRA
jgi:hypothetical protein